jgi:hypothetical protein
MDDKIIGVLIGSAITLVVSVVTLYFNRSNLKLQLNHQKDQDERKAIRQNLEELHEFVVKWTYYSTSYSPEERVKEIDGETLVSREFKTQVPRAISLIALYAPDLHPEFTEFVDLFLKHQRNVHLNETNKLANELYNESYELGREASLNLDNLVYKKLLKINNINHLLIELIDRSVSENDD